jgi:hypothetical protein
VEQIGQSLRHVAWLARQWRMVSEPHKELRFTRSAQALMFCILGAILFGAACTLLATSIYRVINPVLPHPFWALPCLAFAILAFAMARHLAKHAYLLLTPMGVEIFPFYRPAKNMHLIFWQEIADIEFDAKQHWATLHFNPEKTAGVHLALKPIRKTSRALLIAALALRMESARSIPSSR